MTSEQVAEYLEAKERQLPPFEPKKSVGKIKIVF